MRTTNIRKNNLPTILLIILSGLLFVIPSCGSGGGGGGGTVQDTTPPTVSSNSPANGTTGVAANTSVSVTFSEAMDPVTINTSTFTLKDSSNNPVTGTVTYSGMTAIFTPSASLIYSTQYSVRITTGIKDLSGNTMSGEYSWTFTTGVEPDTTPPTVTSTAPANGATDIAVNTSISVTFSEAMDPSSITTATFIVATGGSTVTGTITYSGTTAVFKPSPSADLAHNTVYTATVTSGAKDLAGNGMTDNYSWNFTTSAPVNHPPQANTDTATALINTPVAVDVLANDTDADGNVLSISGVIQPANGIAVVNANGTVTYTPKMGFYGADSFRYSISDGSGGTSEAAVYVSVIGPQGTVSWVKHSGFYGEGVAVLEDGTAFVTGSFIGIATFGAGEPNATTLTSAGGSDVFLAKYNPDGSLAFAKRAGGTGHPSNLGADTGLDVAALPDGTSVVVGLYYGSATFGEGDANETTLVSAGATDIFIAQYNPDGTLAWVRSAGGISDYDYVYGVAVLSDGSSVITGEFEQTAVFDRGGPNEITLTVTSGFRNIFIARYKPDGSLDWARRDGTTNSSSGGLDIGVLPDGSIRVIGNFSGITIFGAGETNSVTLTSPPSPGGGYYSAGFVASYNPNGSFAWVKASGASANGLALLTDGTAFVTGAFRSTATFGSGESNQTVLSSKGGTDIYVARYGPDGLLAWARSAGSADALEYEAGLAIAALPDGSTFVTGSFSGTSVFGQAEANETTLTSAEFIDVFVARYTAAGSLVWAKSVKGASVSAYDRGTGISLASDGSPLVTGGVRGLVIFGQGELNETVFDTGTNYEMFIARYNP